MADINRAIDTAHNKGQRIKTLWWTAHGNAKQVLLGSETLVGWPLEVPEKGIRSVADLHFDKLDPHVSIVLGICSTAGSVDKKYVLNFAEWVQYHAGPTRRVYAAKGFTSEQGLQWNQGNQEQEFTFINSFYRDITASISYMKSLKKIMLASS